MKSETITPLASRMQKMPMASIPRMASTIAIQMMGPVQILTSRKKMSESRMAAKTATRTTGQPSLKS